MNGAEFCTYVLQSVLDDDEWCIDQTTEWFSLAYHNDSEYGLRVELDDWDARDFTVVLTHSDAVGTMEYNEACEVRRVRGLNEAEAAIGLLVANRGVFRRLEEAHPARGLR